MKRRTRFPPIDDSVFISDGVLLLREGGKLSTHPYEGHMPLPWILSSVKWPPSTPPLKSFVFESFPISNLIDFFFFFIELEYTTEIRCLGSLYGMIFFSIKSLVFSKCTGFFYCSTYIIIYVTYTYNVDLYTHKSTNFNFITIL